MADFMRALVTGGAGFIGSNLVDALIERGDEVTVLDNLSTGRRENLEQALAAGAELVEVDLRDAEAVSELVERTRPEVDLPPGRAGGRAQVGRGPGLGLGRERGRHGERAERRQRPRRAPGGVRLDRRRDLRRGADDPGARGPPGGARGALRPLEVLRRELLRAVHPPARAVHGRAALRQRLRPAPGPARRGRRDRDLLRAACSTAAGRWCSATASRRATTSTCRTSSAPTSWPRSRTRAGRSTSAAASRSPCIDIVEALAPHAPNGFDAGLPAGAHRRGAAHRPRRVARA